MNLEELTPHEFARYAALHGVTIWERRIEKPGEFIMVVDNGRVCYGISHRHQLAYAIRTVLTAQPHEFWYWDRKEGVVPRRMYDRSAYRRMELEP